MNIYVRDVERLAGAIISAKFPLGLRSVPQHQRHERVLQRKAYLEAYSVLCEAMPPILGLPAEDLRALANKLALMSSNDVAGEAYGVLFDLLSIKTGPVLDAEIWGDVL